MIYTIGYQRVAIELLDAILGELHADLIDVRSVPHSRRAEFRKAALSKRYADRYVWKGDVLGGQPRGRTDHQVTQVGLDWLRQFDGGKASNVVIMCMEEHPAQCHRFSLICEPHFAHSLHIYQGALYSTADVTRSLTGVGVEPIAGPLALWR